MSRQEELYCTRAVREAARSAVRKLGYDDIKPEQLTVVERFVQGSDVFAILPTGYGKAYVMDVFHLCTIINGD